MAMTLIDKRLPDVQEALDEWSRITRRLHERIAADLERDRRAATLAELYGPGPMIYDTEQSRYVCRYCGVTSDEPTALNARRDAYYLHILRYYDRYNGTVEDTDCAEPCCISRAGSILNRIP